MKKIIVNILLFCCVTAVCPLSAAGSTTITDANWMEMGQAQGIQSYAIGDWWIAVLLADSTGNLYAAGYPGDIPFTAGGIMTNGIAKWDGKKWSPINCDSLHKVVTYQMFLDKMGNLYAPICDLTQKQYDFAKWNGSTWTFLNTGFGVRSKDFDDIGLSTCISACEFDAQGNLYVAGSFDSIGGYAVNHIAKWNGKEWKGLGSGMPDTSGFIQAMAFDETGILYVSYRLVTEGSVVVSSIAKWDGSTWSMLAKGINGYMSSLVIDKNGAIYAGGRFDTAGEAMAHSVAKWDGHEWRALGSGLRGLNSNRATIDALVLDGTGNLWASGSFDSAGGIAACNIAKWDGSAWHAMGNSIRHDVGLNHFYYTGFIRALACGKNDKVYAGGCFNIIGEAYADNIAQWEGSAWSAIGQENSNGLNNYVLACATDKNGSIFAGGQFLTTGCSTLKHIGKWDGIGWTPLATGIEAFWFGLNAIVINGRNIVYAAGFFNTANTAVTNNIAQWDGCNWSSLGSGTNGRIYHLALGGNDTLYASGSFDSAGGVTAHCIAKWDGSSWSALGMSEGHMFSESLPMVVDKDNILYAGNYADIVNGAVTANHIVKWDGSSWTPFGSYKKGLARALAADGKGNLFSGGSYLDTIDGISVNNIAKWDGKAWSTLGKGLRCLQTPGNDFVCINAFEFDKNGNLYAAGIFDSAGQIPARNIARWDGSEWTPLGSGVDNEVDALAFDSIGNLYVGGRFVTAGGKISPHFAICKLGESATLTPETRAAVGSVYLHHNNRLAYLELKATVTVNVHIYSLSGRKVMHTSRIMNAGRHTLAMHPGLARGAYIAQVNAGNESARWRMIIDK